MTPRMFATPRRVTLHQPAPGQRHGYGTRIYYGHPFSGRNFEHIEIVDPPQTREDWQWIQENLVPRLAPGATFCGRLS